MDKCFRIHQVSAAHHVKGFSISSQGQPDLLEPESGLCTAQTQWNEEMSRSPSGYKFSAVQQQSTLESAAGGSDWWILLCQNPDLPDNMEYRNSDAWCLNLDL